MIRFIASAGIVLFMAGWNTGWAQVKKPTTTTSRPASAAVKKPLVAAERLVEIKTGYGTMVAKLYNQTPQHRDNFLQLVEQGTYNGTLFHRVIQQFMIQGGDPTSKDAADGERLGAGALPGDRIPAEFVSNLFHKKGALAAARDNNPELASSNCQIYIVDGRPVSDQEIDNALQRIHAVRPGWNYSKNQLEIYKRIGGTPFLDQSYTVFGEVISGLDVISRIAAAEKDGADRPLQNIPMKIRVLN